MNNLLHKVFRSICLLLCIGISSSLAMSQIIVLGEGGKKSMKTSVGRLSAGAGPSNAEPAVRLQPTTLHNQRLLLEGHEWRQRLGVNAAIDIISADNAFADPGGRVLLGQQLFTSTDYTEPQSSQPTLEETMSFLKAKIENSAGFEGRRPRGSPDLAWTYSYRFIRYEKCFLVLGNTDTMAYDGGREKAVFNDELQIPISEIAVSSIKVKRNEVIDCFTVQFSIFNSQRKIKVQRQVNRSSGTSSLELQWSDFSIYFTDEDVAQRVAKALEHAVNLCGGKKELF